jgi:hypothetical protein
MARSRLASWWIVWTLPVVGIVLGAVGVHYNVNMVDNSSILPPVRDSMFLLTVFFLASLPGWLVLMAMDVLNGSASWTSFPWLPFLLGQAVGFALLGVFMHCGSLTCRFVVRRCRAYIASLADAAERRP